MTKMSRAFRKGYTSKTCILLGKNYGFTTFLSRHMPSSLSCDIRNPFVSLKWQMLRQWYHIKVDGEVFKENIQKQENLKGGEIKSKTLRVQQESTAGKDTG